MLSVFISILASKLKEHNFKVAYEVPVQHNTLATELF